MLKQLYVYHGSSFECLRQIAENGFLAPSDFKHMNDKKLQSKGIEILDPGYFGNGIYQGFAADYAIYYSKKYKRSNEIMMSCVLPGESFLVEKGQKKYGKPCELGHHSHRSPEGKEIVLFQSCQILPLFIIEFEKIPNQKITEEPLE
ncbi:unnamed protein product [Didymodactylos carnosus]|uniref:PARP catalytic domain-containing protein n=1 Tax=Didymodactylos carnosus TaxID=1234261 RepID=A0A8S2G965_9BILA|nr:unnamed protein product [Didymodactylos carnosus]CAF4509256.1 unnamed protein product [Didymodactylos carnosus]